ncbi:hypothetical protein HS041_11020 [Planomonospora sp. ID67723]|uniref:hypothetical protein n=1 Tax=Planomonospora sp. ID67723 TaxID=2738134 RepID=UPI0018C3DA6C|nr:hypothetical protein [Planomonospora sp. ID67723]MBG0828295.1 hypothetical protein [Planomonospora sp. ID67723]
MRITKTLASVVLTTAILGAGAPAVAHAATTGPSVRVAAAEAAVSAGAAVTVNMAGPATPAETASRNPCKRVKNWKARLACEAVKRAGGLWALNKLESAARKGWNEFSRTFESLPWVIYKLLKNYKRGLYCFWSPFC